MTRSRRMLDIDTVRTMMDQPIMTGRDYLTDMNRAIGSMLDQDGDLVSSVAANNLHQQLLSADPELLVGWLRLCAPQLLAIVISNRDRSRRARARSHEPKTGSDLAVATGNVPSIFKTRHVIDTRGTRRPVGEMTGANHLFVADQYAHTAKTNRMIAKFHQAIAIKIGDDRTDSVVDESTYWRLYRSVITGNNE